MATDYAKEAAKAALDAAENPRFQRRLHSVILLVHGAIVIADLLHRVLA